MNPAPGRGGPAVFRLELVPVARRPGLFAALLGGQVELARSRAPVLAAARALLDAGADRTVEDRRYGGTPAAWAAHAGQKEAERLLR